LCAYIFIDPDGTVDFGLVVIVAAATGITYSTQCNGYLTEQRKMEGFLVPLGNPYSNPYAKRLMAFFEKLGCGALGVQDEDIPELQSIIAEIPFWKTGPNRGDDQRIFLELDLSRRDEIVEAWIPIKTAYGPAILTFQNCD